VDFISNSLDSGAHFGLHNIHTPLPAEFVWFFSISLSHQILIR